MAAGESDDATVRTRLREAVERAQNTLEMLRKEQAAGRKIDPEVMRVLEEVIDRHRDDP